MNTIFLAFTKFKRIFKYIFLFKFFILMILLFQCFTFKKCSLFCTFFENQSTLMKTSKKQSKPTLQVSKWSSSDSRFFNNQRIFLHVFNEKSYLNSRQTCMVESIAKNNPFRPIQLFFHTMNKKKFNVFSSWQNVLSKYSNILVELLNETEYFQDTYWKKWQSAKQNSNNAYFIDFIKLLSLFKGGGTYIDLDFIVLKSFDNIWEYKEVSTSKKKSINYKNFLVFENFESSVITNAIMQFEKNHPFIKNVLNLMTKNVNREYDKDSDRLSFLVKESCSHNASIKDMQIKLQNDCDSIDILPAQHFFPIESTNWNYIFRTAIDIPNKTFALCTWNKFSHSEEINLNANSLFSHFAKL